MTRIRAALVVLALFATALATAPAASATSGSCPQYNRLLAAYHLPVSTFSRIMYRESRCIPWARSRSHDSGLLQINDVHRRRGGVAYGLNLYNPRINIMVAARLYHLAGLRPWRATVR
jgi:soluble lytic murein transglycosylase-like protein